MNDFDLIFVTETWLHSDINDSLLLLNSSYSLIRKDRPDKFGGVAIFVKHCLKIVPIDPIPCFQQLECIIIEVLFPLYIIGLFVSITLLHWQMILIILYIRYKIVY